MAESGFMSNSIPKTEISFKYVAVEHTKVGILIT